MTQDCPTAGLCRVGFVVDCECRQAPAHPGIDRRMTATGDSTKRAGDVFERHDAEAKNTDRELSYILIDARTGRIGILTAVKRIRDVFQQPQPKVEP